MAIMSRNKKSLLPLLLACFLLSSNSVHGLEDQQRKPATKVVITGSGKGQSYAMSLRDISNYAELKHNPRASLPSSFTICVSVLATTQHSAPGGGPILFSLLGNDEKQWFSAKISQIGDFVGRKFKYPGANQFVNHDTVPVFPNEWVRSCIALNITSGFVQWVARGDLVDNRTFAGIAESKSIPKDLKGKLILGVFYDHSQQWCQQSNKVTNLHIFASALSVMKMKEYTKGEDGCGEDGDYLSWKDMQWNLHGDSKVEHVDTDAVCDVQSLSLFPAHFPGMESCMHFCENLGGSRVPPVTTFLQWERVLTLMARKQIGKPVWLPISDKQNEAEWRDFYNHQVLNYTLPWVKNEPNGGTSENCASARMSQDGGWLDFGCFRDKPLCLCERDPSFYLELRGLCDSSTIDKYFRPMNNVSDFATLHLVGLQKSTIEFNRKSNNWKLSMVGSKVAGVSNAPHHTFLLGKHEWLFSGDPGCRVKSEENLRYLKLTGCAKGNFTCNDGQCVTMEQRCNQLPDCRDKSDETDCKILVLEKEYNKNVPPITLDNGIKKLVNVFVSIDLSKVVDIDEVDYSVEMQFSITLKWIENRATYQNLKEDRSLNALTQEDIQQLWLPELVYENTDQKESTRLGERWEWKTRVLVERNTNGTPAALEVVDETELFPGGENNLTMFQTYTHDFQCFFDLKSYPFDTQTCSIDMAMGFFDQTSVSLIPDQLHMKQSPDMSIFKIVDRRFAKETHNDGTTTLSMIMVLKRKVTSELMTTYFPTLLLTAITFATTFFKPFFFEAALSVNLTTMLVMTTIFISKMESLPPTSDIKMIDIWLILCQIYPFVEVVLLTAMEYQRGREGDGNSAILLVESSAGVEQNDEITTCPGKFVGVVSTWKAPSLKALGRLI